MSQLPDDHWASKTVIQESELLEHIFEVDEKTSDNMKVSRYCVSPGVDTLDYTSFIDFLRKKFKYYVLSEEEVKQTEDAHYEAQTKSAYKLNAENEGIYGELILFAFVEALLDLPIASHKVAWTQNANDEVKGSDGLFYGYFDGEKSLAIGESKIKGQRSEAIKESLNSINRFYSPEGTQMRKHELTVASNNLPQDLNKEEIKELSKVLTSGPGEHRTIHPMFICYESAKLQNAQESNLTRSDLRDELIAEIKKHDVGEYIEEKIEENYPNVNKHWAIMMLMPVDDTTNLQETLKQQIYPYANQ
ncbi:HamA C-terminal domain-containing protein [Haloarcula argentinensis]|uniref:DUF1837 domain-containing protein n=1 Tax=Haloarcula argentinensis TaxID=43776 RepID=A0ABU2F274_HALAR|nr:DUF1837 domain-containing protein [Haloarcula argentinensis]EMA19190.1 hypothetical protein C443_16266 [Haloarcula argentinensis DSM 12282]MDS0254318.1 DUF1837 domain-containing protein [Haloarcula argentinensis]